jgi:predicted O-methyltransferase YrrM
VLTSVRRSILQAFDWATSSLSLEGCYYGAHENGQVITTPAAYYYFLAGLVAREQCGRICEVGTHMGGSMGAMARGAAHHRAVEQLELVTIDAKQHPAPSWQGFPIHRIQGDALKPKIVADAAGRFSGHVDLLFLDAVHTEAHTRSCLDTYAAALTPRLIVLDDIHLNRSMESLWRRLCEAYGDRAMDVSDLAHRSDCGMGVIAC